MLLAEFGVQVARVHDPELSVGAPGDWPREVVCIEAVRDRHNGLPPEFRKRADETTGGFRRAHHDGGCCFEHPRHSPECKRAMKPRRIDHHLVERPRIAEVSDPWLA